MLRITDSSSDEEDINLAIGKKIRQFIRLKEAENIRTKLLTSNGLNGHVTKIKNCRISDHECDSDQHECLDNDSSENNDEKINKLIKAKSNYPNDWKHIWYVLNEQLKALKHDENHHRCLEISTSILKRHIDNHLNLDIKCFSLIFHCIRPDYIVKLFDMNLIEDEDLSHIGCLIECEDLFTAINEYADDIFKTNKYSFQILKSLSIMFYKHKCLKNTTAIVKSLHNVLAIFINREDHDIRRTGQVKREIRNAVKDLILACALNGILSGLDIDAFLAINYEAVDELSFMDYDSDESEDQLIFRFGAVPRRNVDRNNNVNIANNTNKTIAQRLNLTPKEFMNKLFPLSLQNLARIKIKNSMNDYSIRGVNKLEILPNVIKKFVLFDDEINNVIKSNPFLSL